MKKIVLSALLMLPLVACGHHLSGTYVAQQSSPIAGASLDFISSTAVQVQVAGTTTQGTYKLEDQKVAITNNGLTQVLTIASNGCLDGGPKLGSFCKQ